MQEQTVVVKNYSAEGRTFPLRKQEVWRYSGYQGIANPEESLENLLEEVLKECENIFSYKVSYLRTKISWKDGFPVLPFSSDSKDLAKCIEGSEEVILFAATIGMQIDRLIMKYQRTSPAKALLLQAYGAERVEALCDGFVEDLEKEISPKGFTPRFSPGYGDLSLSVQKDMISLLDTSRRIGITLNDSLLMNPSKSVTAIMGIKSCSDPVEKHTCKNCSLVNCSMRRAES